MKILIPKDDAVAILNQRLQEIGSYGFNAQVWKNRVVLDLKQIFGELGDQWLQIDSIKLDTFITSDRVRVLNEGINIIAGSIRSYIQMIQQYTEISSKKSKIQENTFENKYSILLDKYNGVVSKHNDLVGRNKSISELMEEVKSENQHLKYNTLQLDNVTFKRLWIGVQNLPTIQVVYIISVIAAIVVAAFALGQVLEKNSANNESFDLKNENRELKASFEMLDRKSNSQTITINSLKETIKKQNDSIVKMHKK